MNRFWTLLTDVRVLGVLGFAALAAFLFLGADALEIALVWAGLALGLVLLVWAIAWLVRTIRARRAAQRMEEAIDAQTEQARRTAPAQERGDIDTLRDRLREAVKTIKTSRLGQTTGAAALYELPWYIVIGNPAAGKSTAIVKSGLKFPFADKNGGVVTGVGGTRNCDWFFTSEGILLDTAGRYSVHEEDRSEWLGFLALLKKHRPKAPINGIIIAASLAELGNRKPEAAIQLAKNLRQRVQELTENLEVVAPVYLVFTKADLIAGFTEFFEDRDRAERERVWGATLPYDPLARTDAVAQFEQHFDELFDGLKEMSVARMSLHRGEQLPPGVLTFPLEFAAMKTSLRAFVATLFEDNPYQFPPVFRGFYFTSALQEGSASSRAREHVANRFALNDRPEHVTAMVAADNGFFLRDLFSRVVFADRNLVRQHASRAKLRTRVLAFGVAVAVLAGALALWTWSYLGNRQLVANVRADLEHAVALQTDKADIASRIAALEVLQNRIEQLEAYKSSRPLSIGLGLYQGGAIEARLRQEYFDGTRQLLVEPVSQAIEAYLDEVNRNPGRLKPMVVAPASGAAPAGSVPNPQGLFVEASVESVEDAYNALKTHLMLARPERREAGHLRDQLTRFWRSWLEANRGGMPREQMLRGAGRLVDFAMANLQDPAFSAVNENLTMAERTRATLLPLMRGMAAKERVYADVKAAAATRFAPVTVARIVGDQDRDVVAGSHAVPGAFTREAWQGYVEAAFKEAASGALQSTDWVLGTAARTDLGPQGSPEQIRKELTDLYKAEYTREWIRFVQGIAVERFGSFDVAVARLNRLGDKEQSPLKKILQTVFDQTSWDNPSLLNERLGKARTGVLEWIKQTILRQAPSQVDVNLKVDGPKAEIPMGPIGKEFGYLARVMMARDNAPTPMASYLELLGKARTRFNQLRAQGDPGPGARKFVGETLAGSGELAEAQRFIEEQMVAAGGKETLRPLLLRPILQALDALIEPTETELNRIWQAQVFDGYQRTLAGKYPFDAKAKIEATPADIQKVFGPSGSVARFGNEALAGLVTRRGDSLAPVLAWGEYGIRLRRPFVEGFPGWVAAIEGPAGGTGGGGGTAPTSTGGGTSPNGTPAPANPAASDYVFEILPKPTPGLREYTLEIDGQKLVYNNAQANWQRFSWPGPGVKGAKITFRRNDGSAGDLVSEPGGFGWGKLVERASGGRSAANPGLYDYTWSGGGTSVSVQLRMISQPRSPDEPAPPTAPPQKPGVAPGTPAPAPIRPATTMLGVPLTSVIAGTDGAPEPTR